MSALWKSLISVFSKDPPPPPEIQLIVDEPDLSDPWAWIWNTQYAAAAAATIVLGISWALLIWLYFGERKRSPVTSAQSADQDQDAAINAVQRKYSLRIEEIEKQFRESLRQTIEDTEKRAQLALAQQCESVEANVRKGLNMRLDALDFRTKLDQEAMEGIHRTLNQRMETFEEGIRALDSKHLDIEAIYVVQRGLGQRLEAVEGSMQAIDGKTRASVQRIDAMDDSLRIIDSRSKALSQRVEAVEDNVGSVDGQTTLLSHDVNRGGLAIEKLQRQVKMLPDADKFKGLSRTWDHRFKKIEAKMEEQQATLEEDLAALAQPPAILSLSHIETREIEPSGLYLPGGGSDSFPFDDYMSPGPSSSFGSQSSGSHHRAYSTASTSPSIGGPMTPERKGFREMTFSSKQKLLASRNSWTR